MVVYIIFISTGVIVKKSILGLFRKGVTINVEITITNVYKNGIGQLLLLEQTFFLGILTEVVLMKRDYFESSLRFSRVNKSSMRKTKNVSVQ